MPGATPAISGRWPTNDSKDCDSRLRESSQRDNAFICAREYPLSEPAWVSDSRIAARPAGRLAPILRRSKKSGWAAPPIGKGRLNDMFLVPRRGTEDRRAHERISDVPPGQFRQSVSELVAFQFAQNQRPLQPRLGVGLIERKRTRIDRGAPLRARQQFQHHDRPATNASMLVLQPRRHIPGLKRAQAVQRAQGMKPPQRIHAFNQQRPQIGNRLNAASFDQLPLRKISNRAA